MSAINGRGISALLLTEWEIVWCAHSENQVRTTTPVSTSPHCRNFSTIP